MQVVIKGLEDIKRNLEGFSDRRFAAAVATALTRAGWAIRDDWKQELQSRVDRPTSLTMNSPRVKMATANELVAIVSINSQLQNGIPPSEYLKPLEFGGNREHKKFETALISQGSMPAGMYALPTDNAERDNYGNVRRQILVQVLTQLAGGNVSSGYRRVISASAQKRAASAIKSGRQYIAVLQTTGRLTPGIYLRQRSGDLLMIFSYERQVSYRRQLSLADRANAKAPKEMDSQLTIAIQKHIADLAAKRK